MKCIIVDDEAVARSIVRQLCETSAGIEVLEEFSNPIEAIKYLNQHKVDVVFLDIHMPGFTGFDFVQTLKNPPVIVLTTTDNTSALEAYEYEAITDYLVKPITKERFEKALVKINNALNRGVSPVIAASETNGKKEDLYINIDRRLTKIKFEEIYFIKATGDYIDLKTAKGVFKVHSTLKKTKDKLPEEMFLQIHRSYIINLNQIIDIEDNSVLIDKHVVPISRSNRPELIRRLNLL